MLSNRNLAVIALVLIIGAVGDGVLYNRPVANATIYSVNNAQSIEIKYQGDVVLTLRKSTDEWLVTAPFHAPARQSRVSLLLDSNKQTARSYTAEELQSHATGDELVRGFPDPVELRVDGNLFLLGNIEPVSQLRYVTANNNVYLQADHIVPMLQSPKSTFTDLTITKTIESVDLHLLPADAINTTDDGRKTIQPASAELLAHWNNLDALMVINADLLDQPSIGTATVDQSANAKQRFDIFRFQQFVALRPDKSLFAYLISEQQADELGICVYC